MLNVTVGGCEGISLSRLFWLRVLELMYPELELVRSTTIRSTVDTFRNVGIITVVLQVKGVCQIDQFIAKIQVSSFKTLL